MLLHDIRPLRHLSERTTRLRMLWSGMNEQGTSLPFMRVHGYAVKFILHSIMGIDGINCRY